MPRHVPIVIAVGLLAGATASAQEPKVAASFTHSLESSDAGNQQVLAGAFSAAHWFAADRLRVAYDLEGGDFNAPGDWTYLTHEAGATWRHDLGSAHHLFAGGAASWRQNGASWTIADYRAVGGFLNVELNPAPTAAVRGGYSLDVRRFPSEPRLDQLEQSLFGSVRFNLPSGTTLIGEGSTGSKHYDPIATPAATGRRLDLLLRVGQSVATRTGLSVEAAHRHVFGDVPPLVVETPAGFFDDGIYDDRFASDLTRIAASLKTIVARGTTLELGGMYEEKPYWATPAVDLAGRIVAGTIRRDRITRAGASATVPIFPDSTGPVDVDLVAGYSYTRQRSTSSGYDYASHALAVGAALRY